MSVPAPRARLMPAREVPLGGLRSMNVQRALPQRGVPTVGAWCFLDRFGPQRTAMRVDPHPHMGLQTVTWPLVGEVRHRDSIGSDAVLSPGQLNLMTAGLGIAHSEYSLGDGAVELDALQLWIALPEATRRSARGFERHESLPSVRIAASHGDDALATVIMGSFAGVTSPATTYSPLVGAQVLVTAGSRVTIPLTSKWEHAVVLLAGDVLVHASTDGVDTVTRPARNDRERDSWHRAGDRDRAALAADRDGECLARRRYGDCAPGSAGEPGLSAAQRRTAVVFVCAGAVSR